MYKNHLKYWLLTALLALAFISRAFAAVSPMWTFATVTGYPPLVSIENSKLDLTDY